MLTHSTSNYSIQQQLQQQQTTTLQPLKLVDVVFTKNLDTLAHTLKKCQIPLVVDDCPTLVLQFDQEQLLLHQNCECCSKAGGYQVKSNSINNTSNILNEYFRIDQIKYNRNPCNWI